MTTAQQYCDRVNALYRRIELPSIESGLRIISTVHSFTLENFKAGEYPETIAGLRQLADDLNTLANQCARAAQLLFENT